MATTLPLLFIILAQAPAPPTSDPQAKPKAQALLKEGTALYEHGDLTGALEKFEAAYSVFPSPKLQFNIGQTNRDLGRPVEALTAFENFLANATDAAPELVAEARQSTTDLAAKLGRLKVECSTTGAEATLDGKPLGTTPIDRFIWVVPGHHQVTFRRSAYMPIIADVTIAAGETQAVRRTLLLTDAPAAPSPATAPPPTLTTSASTPPGPASDRGPSVWSRHKWYFWAAAGGTVAFAAGAIAAGLSANGHFNDLQNSCGKTTAGCTDDQINGVNSRAMMVNVLWGLAGVSAVATGVSFYIDSREAVASIAMSF